MISPETKQALAFEELVKATNVDDMPSTAAELYGIWCKIHGASKASANTFIEEFLEHHLDDDERNAFIVAIANFGSSKWQ